MKQCVECKDEAQARALLERIENETSMKWKYGLDLAKWEGGASAVTNDFTIGFDSKDRGLSIGWYTYQGRHVSADYFILSLKIYELKHRRKALEESANGSR